MFYLNWTGKALAVSAGARLLRHAFDRWSALSAGPTSPPDPNLGLPPAVADDLAAYVELGARRGFESRLDELGAPDDTVLRDGLWRALGRR